MAEVKDKPADIPTTNALAGLPGGEPDTAYVGFQSNGAKVENPPDLGDSGTLVVHWKCIEAGDKEAADGEIRPKRVLKVTAVHWPGKRPLPADENQGELFDETEVHGIGDDPAFSDDGKGNADAE